MAGKRKVEVEIVSTAKGGGFKESEREATKWSKKLGDEGRKAGDQLSKGVGDGVSGLGDKVEGVGEEVGDKLGDGVSRGFRGKLKGLSDHFDSDMRSRMSGVAGGIMRAFGKELGVTAKPTAATVATAFSASFLQSVAAGLASGAGKLAHGFAAVLALLPAAAITAAVGMGVLKVALSGVGDALSAGLTGDAEAFNEALKEMGPAASEFARGVVSLRDELGDLKGAVQESFFEPFADSVRPLGELYLPMVQDRLAGIAGDFGVVGNRLTTWLRFPDTASSIADALDNMGVSIGDVSEGAIGLARAFLPLVAVGSSFLPGLTGGFDQLTNRLAAFMIEAERTGRLHEFISNGLSSLGDLVETGRQLGRIFGNVGSIFSKAFAGMGLKSGGLLDSLESLTERAEKFFKSASGGKVMGQVFETVSAVVNTMLGTLQRVGGMIGRVFGPIMPSILDFIEALANLKSAVLDTALDALEPVLQGIADVLGGVVLPALTSLANWLTDNRPVLQGVAIAIGVLLVPAFVSWAISAGVAAAATLLAMAPIILIGAAIAGLAALVIIHFDTIKRWISNVWQWVSDHWPLLFGILTGPIGLAVGFIVGNFDAVVGFAKKLPGRIGAAVSGLWESLKSGLVGTLNWIIGKLNTALDAMDKAAGPFVNFGEIPTISGPTSVRARGGGGSSTRMAEGGIVKHRPGGILATIGEGRHDEAVIPLDGRHGLGGGVTININNPIISSSSDAERWVTEALTRALQVDPSAVTVRGRPL